MIRRFTRWFYVFVSVLFWLLLRQIHQNIRTVLFPWNDLVVMEASSSASSTSVIQPKLEVIMNATANWISKSLLSTCSDHHNGHPDIETCFLHGLAQRVRRAFVPNPLSHWCHRSGIVLIKVPKSGSSTTTGVVLRIQNQHACVESDWPHATAREKIQTQNQNTSTTIQQTKDSSTAAAAFWLTSIRDPNARALSAIYFYKVSFHRKRIEMVYQKKQQQQQQKHPAAILLQNTHPPVHVKPFPSDAYVLKELRATPSNFITDYIIPFHSNMTVTTATTNITSQTFWEDIVDMVQRIIQSYDFWIVTDRMDESLVVLSWLMQIPVTDIMVTSSKISGSWYWSDGRCMTLVPPQITPVVQQYFRGREWQRLHIIDRFVYIVANQSLDATIQQSMGRTEFQKRFQLYQTYKRQIQSECASEIFTPCDSQGRPRNTTNCYLRDFGCGYPCVDRILHTPPPPIPETPHSNKTRGR